MFGTFIQKMRLVFGDPVLRGRILMTVGILILARVLAVFPIPGINSAALASLFTGNQFLSLLNIFSGGGLSSLSIVMLGVSPYITASIIMQLLTLMVPRLKEMYQEEGDAGRRKFAQYSRLLTVPLALLQGYAFLTLFQRQGVLPSLTLSTLALDMVLITAGSLLMVWLGEIITEFGVGNGISLIIFAGIVSRLPGTLGQLIFTFDPSQLPTYIGMLVLIILVIVGVVIVTEAERPIPITYAKQMRGGSVSGGMTSYLPLRLNQAGVIPIIFALSVLLFPQMILQFLGNSSNVSVAHTSATLLGYLTNVWFYDIAYFLLVFVFTYFYTAVTFDPDQMAENLQKSGAFVSGVRPGEPTAAYVSKVLTRLTLIGALFLGAIAVLPLVLRSVTGQQSLAIGGTALLIAVTVVIDLVKKIDAQITAQQY
ncbi:preprotein translocase subunit SecY [Candidatus Parcubacteria bacterium]|nr:preprotein translocase subunit SecY [Candidatus Parcubacteria bacterium]